MSNYRIALYVRESRDDNEENYETIETQRDLLVDFVKRNGLGDIYRIYMDDNVSGSVFDREGIRQFEEDVIAGRVNLLLVKDLSRLGRNNARTLLFLDFLEEYGVRVITFDGRYDSIRDSDTVGIETWVNERYVRDLSRKIRANLRFKIQKGEYIGHAPFGYLKSKTEKNRLVVDRETAGTVKEIYRLYREGNGYSSIARHLNEKGVAPPSGKGRPVLWNPASVRRILCNRVYTGDTVQGISERLSFKSKKTRRLPRDRWVITENTHEAIVSREEFIAVREIRERKKSFSGTNKGKIHLLSGILFCGKCGSPMYARKRNRRPLGYICGRYGRNGTASCTSHHIGEKTILAVITEEILDLARHREIRKSAEALFSKNVPEAHGAADTVNRLEKLLLSRQKQQEMLYMDRLEGRISDQLFARMNESMEKRIASIREEIERARVLSESKPHFGDILDEFLNRLKDGLVTREMIRTVVQRITVHDPDERADFPDGAIMIDFQMKKV